MSNNVLPTLFVSLGGEMLYVLDQRLRAQEVAMQKGSRVMGEIVSNMFNRTLMQELFKSQSVYSRKGIAAMFERLVNSSIMRIDGDSMEKLYDLMLMTFKYQIVKSRNLIDVLHVTLNHLDSILKFVKARPEAEKLALEGYKETVRLYENMPIGDLILVKQTLLSFVHDLKSKVSVLVSMGDQNMDGTFVIDRNIEVPLGCDVPGIIRYCDEGRTENFATGAKFRTRQMTDASTAIGGIRTTDLGINLYDTNITSVQPLRTEAHHSHAQSLAEAEVKLLGHLMGTSAKKSETFKLDLFKLHDSGGKVEKAAGSSLVPVTKQSVVTIQAEKLTNKELSDIKGNFSSVGDQGQSDDQDLLSLMDNA